MAAPTRDIEQIGPRVRRLREERGISQQDLAKKAGIDAWTLRWVENSRGQSRGTTYGRIAMALGISMAELLGEDGS